MADQFMAIGVKLKKKLYSWPVSVTRIVTTEHRPPSKKKTVSKTVIYKESIATLRPTIIFLYLDF